jgi:biopolymer transport protein ExbB/TolQ
MYELYVSGGIPYMHPISIVFIINLIVSGYVAVQLLQRKSIGMRWINTIKQLGGLALALGVLGTIIGFFQMFGALEEMKETLPLNVISGGTKVALITALYGLIVFCISLVLYIIFKLTHQKLPA